jgi:hypothetical protein
VRKILCCLAVVSVFTLLFIHTDSDAAGMLWPLRVGETFTFDVTDSVGNTWEQKVGISGFAWISSNGKGYYVMEQSGYDCPGSYGMVLLRSTPKEVYAYDGLGIEYVGLQNAPVGTTWTYEKQQGCGFTEVIQKTILAIETVQVPAGTFDNCLKFRHWCVNCDPSILFTDEWIKPGFGMVKQIDYAGGQNPPREFVLKSWTK